MVGVAGSSTPPRSTRRPRRCPAAATPRSPTSRRRPACYVLDVAGAVGAYDGRSSRATAPAPRSTPNKTQTVYLDFEGGRVNTGVWGGPGVRELSPFSAFLGKWGIPPLARGGDDHQDHRRGAQEHPRRRCADGGSNPNLEVDGRQLAQPPRDHGQANVSRVIVGGTIAQSGIATIGIAQYIDPGNYGHEDAALVLLDVLSDPERSGLAQHLPHRGQRPGEVRLGRGRQRDRSRGRPHRRQLPHRQPLGRGQPDGRRRRQLPEPVRGRRPTGSAAPPTTRT